MTLANMAKENRVRILRLAGCFLNFVIILLLAAYTLTVAAMNSKIEELKQTPIQLQGCLELCPYKPIQRHGKCCANDELQCLTGMLKSDCLANLLKQKTLEVNRLQECFYSLSFLGFAFLSLECLLIPCFSWLSTNTRETSKYRKTDGICTFQGSISSKSSFSSLNDPLNPNQIYYHEDESCPVCLQTIQDQRVSKLACHHIVHYNCSNSKCPICKPSY